MALSVRSVKAVRPSTGRVASVRPGARPVSRMIVRADPAAKVALESAIKEAEVTCAEGSTGACAAAWDNVEELSATVAHQKAADAADNSNDPLEKFCGDNPDADECRVYDD